MGPSRDQSSKSKSNDRLRVRLSPDTWDGVCCGNCPPNEDWNDEEEGTPYCFGTSDALDPLRLARSYALGYKSRGEVDEDLRWASECVFSMLFEHPEAALEIIRQAAELAETDWQRTLIGCGNLESLLGNHGRKMIGAVEQLARESPAFRECLSNVWRHGMADDVWARVLAASGREPAK